MPKCAGWTRKRSSTVRGPGHRLRFRLGVCWMHLSERSTLAMWSCRLLRFPLDTLNYIWQYSSGSLGQPPHHWSLLRYQWAIKSSALCEWENGFGTLRQYTKKNQPMWFIKTGVDPRTLSRSNKTCPHFCSLPKSNDRYSVGPASVQLHCYDVKNDAKRAGWTRKRSSTVRGPGHRLRFRLGVCWMHL